MRVLLCDNDGFLFQSAFSFPTLSFTDNSRSGCFCISKTTSPATGITLSQSSSNSRFQMIISIIDLITLEFILLFKSGLSYSLMVLSINGKKFKIPEGLLENMYV